LLTATYIFAGLSEPQSLAKGLAGRLAVGIWIAKVANGGWRAMEALFGKGARALAGEKSVDPERDTGIFASLGREETHRVIPSIEP
jgi:hypothetical protein